MIVWWDNSQLNIYCSSLLVFGLVVEKYPNSHACRLFFSVRRRCTTAFSHLFNSSFLMKEALFNENTPNKVAEFQASLANS
jgi:hypothetical protein